MRCSRGFGVTHTYEEYDGDHTNKVFERIEQNVLPFFSKHLSFDAGDPRALTRGSRLER